MALRVDPVCPARRNALRNRLSRGCTGHYKVELSGIEPESSQPRHLRSTCVVPVSFRSDSGRDAHTLSVHRVQISRSIGAVTPVLRHPILKLKGRGSVGSLPGPSRCRYRSGRDESFAIGEVLDLGEIGVGHERIVVVRVYLSAPTLAVVESHSLARCSVVLPGCRNLSAPCCLQYRDWGRWMQGRLRFAAGRSATASAQLCEVCRRPSSRGMC